jgi:glycine cleavage system transcriptional repressor
LNHLIITAIGSDRPGIVSELSGVVTSHGANVEESRMARLGSDFAILMLVSVQPDWQEALKLSLQSISGLTITTKGTDSAALEAGKLSSIHLEGADNEGIVQVLSNFLAEQSINITEMETHISHAPVSGTPLFNLNATISIPKEVNSDDLQDELSHISHKLGVEIQLD